MNRTIFFLLFLLSLPLHALLLPGCGSQKALIRKGKKQLDTRFLNSGLFNQAFTGFALYDPGTKTWLYERNSDKYFSPASNVKILTLYTALQILGDSIPALTYITRGDSLIFQGTAHPGLEHPLLPTDSTVLGFLKSRPEALFFSSSNFNDQPYGPAWAWDDIPYSFQCQRSPLPFHGNLVRASWQEQGGRPSLYPPYFEKYLHPSAKPQRRLQNQPFRNYFTFPRDQPPGEEFEQLLPYHVSDSLVAILLSRWSGRPVDLDPLPAVLFDTAKVLYTYQTDTLYRRMMQESDNFLAEQLLLCCSNSIFGEINSSKIIRYAKESFFRSLPDTLIWQDGSGLSRYNLLTPRAITIVLEQLVREFGEERLYDLFAAGGQSGTLKDWYAGVRQPYVFAKTGTLRNQHCLSGYLVTQSNKQLIFSFMHNNYPGTSRQYKSEMQHFLKFIHEYY